MVGGKNQGKHSCSLKNYGHSFSFAYFPISSCLMILSNFSKSYEPSSNWDLFVKDYDAGGGHWN